MTRLLALLSSALSVAAFAVSPPISFLPTMHRFSALPSSQLEESLAAVYAGTVFREIRVQAIVDTAGGPDHLLVYLLSPDEHRVDYAKIGIDRDFHFHSVQDDYHPDDSDRAEQWQVAAAGLSCPDPSVEFISFCPNNNSLELSTTREVTTAARAAGLKTVELLTDQATRQNYLNYLTCPKLIGNFYDGDSNQQSITTSDGAIFASEFSNYFRGAFKYWVTNIWVACQAFNDPLLGALIDDSHSKRYAAGISDLKVGPSDRTAACAMEAALNGEPITESFQECVQKEDVSSDRWGLGGEGANLFQWNPPP